LFVEVSQVYAGTADQDDQTETDGENLMKTNNSMNGTLIWKGI